MTGTSLADAATLIPVLPVPGSTITAALGINDSNTIVGLYLSSDGVEHGFYGSLDGNYTTFDVGATYTEPHAINNDGYIVGFADQGGASVAFERYPDGTAHILTIDGRTMTTASAYGINSKGFFVGTGFDGNDRHPFLAKDAQFLSDVVVPGRDGIEPRGINDAGTIVGNYGHHGFLLKNGVETRIDYPDPDAKYNWPRGINSKEVVVGYWLDRGYRHEHPFIFDAKDGTYMAIKIPHSKQGGATGINSAGLIAVSTDIGSFIYCPHSKRSGKCPAVGAEAAEAKPVRALPGVHR